MPLFLVFIAIPLTEISLLVVVGQNVGLIPIIAHILLTATVGAWALRRQGRVTLAKLQSGDPMMAAAALGDGAFLVIAGLCLITPGFLTDFAGVSLLIPAVRRRARAWVSARISVAAATARSSSAERPAAAPEPDPFRDPEVTRAEPVAAGRRRGPAKPDRDADDARIVQDDP